MAWLSVNKLDPVSSKNDALTLDSSVASKYKVPPLLCDSGILCSMANAGETKPTYAIDSTKSDNVTAFFAVLFILSTPHALKEDVGEQQDKDHMLIV